MDSIQKQVTALTHKVDALHQVVEQMSQKVTESISENKQKAVQGNHHFSSENSVRQYSYQSQSRFEPIMTHKDVLVDSNSFDKDAHQNSEKELSPEIQIQRLTAQLTAAYNRIAALEEQLLARRIHS